jgi:hypothetical protein
MVGFKKPKKGSYKRFLYIDGNEAVNSLSAIEGGSIEEILSRAAEEGSGGGQLEAGLGFSGAKVGGKAQKKKARRYEEEILRKRTEHSAVSILLEKLRGGDEIGIIESYTPDIHEQIEEDELYEFKAEIRLHPFHQFVSIVQGWSETGENLDGDPQEIEELVEIARQAENLFHGKNKDQKALVVFAEMEGVMSEYKLVVPIKRSGLRVPLDEFSGRATFVAQVERKLEDGDRVLAARIVRNAPVLPMEREMMLEMLPALQGAAEDPDLGLEIDEADVLLREPALIMKPLCIFKG